MIRLKGLVTHPIPQSWHFICTPTTANQQHQRDLHRALSVLVTLFDFFQFKCVKVLCGVLDEHASGHERFMVLPAARMVVAAGSKSLNPEPTLKPETRSAKQAMIPLGLDPKP